jgi:Tat protein translocase TatB subunit
MVPGIGGAELIVIAAVALIVVGPKDLPKLLRKAGQFVGKMRSMADEFRQNFDDMARQSEIDELRLEVEALKSGRNSNPIVRGVLDDLNRIESEIDERLITASPNLDLDNEISNVPTVKSRTNSRRKKQAVPEIQASESLSAEPIIEEKPLTEKRSRKKSKPSLVRDLDQ